MYKKGTVILVPFPFTDLSKSRVRPAVVLSHDKIAGDDVIVAFISSVMPSRLMRSEYRIDLNHPHFSDTGLKVPSIIRCDKIATLDKKIILGELGFLAFDLYKEIEKRLRYVFGL